MNSSLCFLSVILYPYFRVCYRGIHCICILRSRVRLLGRSVALRCLLFSEWVPHSLFHTLLAPLTRVARYLARCIMNSITFVCCIRGELMFFVIPNFVH